MYKYYFSMKTLGELYFTITLIMIIANDFLKFYDSDKNNIVILVFMKNLLYSLYVFIMYIHCKSNMISSQLY